MSPKHSYGQPPNPNECDLTPRWYKLDPHPEQRRYWTSSARFKVVPAGRRSGKCLAKGTLVTMANGKQKPVEKIRAGDMVLSANPMYVLEPKEVEHVLKNGKKPIVQVKLSGTNEAFRYLRCTSNHPIWANKKWVEAGDLERGMLVAVSKQYSDGCEFIPLTYDEVVVNTKYEPVKFQGYRKGYDDNIKDAPSDLLLVMKQWQMNFKQRNVKQSIERISLRQLDKIKKYLDLSLYNFLVNADITWERVLSVKEVKPEKTYDLTVKDYHNFLANGIVTHNTELAKRKLIARCISPWDDKMPLPSILPPSQCSMEPGKEHGPRYFVAAPTWSQARRIYWSDLKTLIPDWAIPGRDRRTAFRESEMMIKFNSGAQLWVVGMDKPERIEGSPWDGGILDEYGNMKARAWPENIRPALSDRRGWCDFIGVPEGRNHYYDLAQHAKRIEREALEKGKDPEWSFFSWKSADILPEEEILSAKTFLDPMTYAQEYEADFLSFQGRAYYPFDERTHCRPLQYNKTLPLVFCFDFNKNPGVAVVCQEQLMPGVTEIIYDKKSNQSYERPVIGTGVIGEVYIPQNSNTVAVCNKLVYDWGMHEGEIHIYADATGGAGGSSSVEGSDLDLIRKAFQGQWESSGKDRKFHFTPQSNPRERVRVNCLNSRLMSISGTVRLMTDPQRCPNLIKDFLGVRILDGGDGSLDKKSSQNLTHLCFADGTKVETDNGIMNIEKLPSNGLIRAWNNSFVPFINYGLRGEKETIKLTFNDGDSVVCTIDHLFLTNKGWQPTKDINGLICFHNYFKDKKVVGIDSFGKKDVFCPTIQRDGCFALANGLIVSNSDAIGYYISERFPLAELRGTSTEILW